MSARSRKGALVFGLLLIGIGLMFFLANWYSPARAWELVARYWPVFPILIGVKKLYGYFTWTDDPGTSEAARKSARRRRPSLLGGLLWAGLGVLFLLRNFGIGPDFWSLAGRYWPILLILLGLGKVIDYFRQSDGVSLRFGEVFSLLLVLIIGSALSKIPNSAMRDLFWMNPINIGGTNVNLSGPSFGYTQEISYPLPLGLTVRVENSHGTITVSPGSDREVRIRLRKVVYESDESRAKTIADQIRIEGGEEGGAEASVYVVRTNRDDLASKDYRFRTDMDVFVPKQVQLEIRNPFGGVNASGLDGRLDIQSSHQLLEVRDCSGSIAVANRYGDSRLTDLTGTLSVDARGRVTVQGIKGDIDVRDEYSPVVISAVDGRATVTNTEGSITMENVGKPVIINARGSQVTVSNLRDTLKVTSSHRRIQISDVESDVTLSSGYSTSTLRRIKGNVDIESNSDRISIEDIGGYLKVAAQGSSTRVNNAAGPLDIRTTLKDVVVNGFSRGCTVINEFGDVTLSAAVLGKEEIRVQDRNGDISLFLPPDAAFEIDATAHNGRIIPDFPGLTLPAEGDGTALKYNVKSGGPRIRLETENSDISIRAREPEQTKRNRN
jgi:ribosomal protein L6P/L9E